MNVLVIGGAGFVGTNLVRRYAMDADTRITVFDSLDPHFQSTTDHLQDIRDRIRFVQGDIRDEAAVRQVVENQDIAINCAAQTSHPLSIEQPLLDAQINCLGNLVLLEALRKRNSGARIIYVSSATVVGRTSQESVDEDHGERPLDIYSANKGVAEKYYRIYHTAHGLQTVVLRLPNLYGPFGKSDAKFGFINYFIHLARRNRDITIFGKGDQTRNVMFIDDAVDLLRIAATHEQLVGETWFATGDEQLAVRDIAGTIVDVFGGGRVVHVDWPEDRLKIEVGTVTYGSQRLRDTTGWKPRFHLRDGLERTRDIIQSQQP